MIPRVHKTEKEDRIMIHKNISIKAEGSLKDSHLTTYILDSYEELEPNLKRPLVLICPGGAYRFTADREAEMIALHLNSAGYHLCCATLFLRTGNFSNSIVRSS